MPIRDKRSKKAVYMDKKGVLAIFSAYRVGQRILGGELAVVRVKPVPGYERAIDPDLIHAARVFPPPPTGFEVADPTVRKWVDFTRHVERCVSRLSADERAVVRVKYMGPYVLTDQEAVRMMARAGVQTEIETFRSVKQSALGRLSTWFARSFTLP